MITGLDTLLATTGKPGLQELRRVLDALFRPRCSSGRVIEQLRLASQVYRVRLALDGAPHSVIVKHLGPEIARRNHLVATRWLPALGLGRVVPSLVGVAAAPHGQCVWHVYEDLGDHGLVPGRSPPDHVEHALRALAAVHAGFVGHALLPECRLYGGDLSARFHLTSITDALTSLRAVPSALLSRDRRILVERLVSRLEDMRSDSPRRAQLLSLGGPDTLVHGDCWPKNVLVRDEAGGLRACFIDWDHAALGPASYDLSTFLYRFPLSARPRLLSVYQEALGRYVWTLPEARTLHEIFALQEEARITNRLIWPAIAVHDGHVDWAFSELARVETWFETMKAA
ncbi:MAG: phosphotransferase [Myxococcota bacterium]